VPYSGVVRLLCASDDPTLVGRLVAAVDSRLAIGHVPLERLSAVAAAISHTGWDALAVLTADPERVPWPTLTHVCRVADLPIVWSMPEAPTGTAVPDVPFLPWHRLVEGVTGLVTPKPDGGQPTWPPAAWSGGWARKEASDTPNLQAVLDDAVDLLVPAVADLATALVLNADGTVAHLAARHHDPSGQVITDRMWSLPEWRDNADWNGQVRCAVSGRPLFLPQVPAGFWDQLGVTGEVRHLLGQLDPQAVVTMPFVTAAGQRGAVAMLACTPGSAFAPDMLRHAEDFAEQTRIAWDRQARLVAAIESSQRYQLQAERNFRQLTLAGKLATLRQLPDAATAMVAAVRDEIPDAHVACWLLSDDGDMLTRTGSSAGASLADIRDDWQVVPMHVANGVTEAVTTGRSVLLATREHLLTCYPHLAGDRSVQRCGAWASIPMIQDGRAIGALGIAFDSPRPFDPDEVAHLEALARLCAQACERGRLYSSLSNSLQENARLVAGLQQSDRRKNTFLAMLAHELRNPLGALANALYLLKQPAESAAPDRQQRTVAIMDRQIEHLRRLLDDLIDLARITQGKITLDRQPVDLTALLPDAIEDWRTQNPEGVVLATDWPATPVWVAGERSRLVQVLNNLLDNARRFSPDGTTIAIRMREDGNGVTLCITDQGIGLTPDQISTIFEPFTQLGPNQQGLGLGLPLVEQLVQLHDGRIEASSDGPDQGSRFAIWLPVIPPPGGTDPSVAQTPVAPSLRVLVIEDHDDARETLGELLEIWGHRPVLAGTGQKGLDLLLANDLDIALVDIQLPDIDGYAVARGARTKLGPAFPLVALTGFGQAHDRQQALAAGFTDHVTKPLDPDRLQALIVALCLPASTVQGK
jgi:signal transduction histidine kinase/ActR/RegA family two-component response regulator